jgi:hypothetical protein
MANFIGVTASSGAKIKAGKKEEVEKLIAEYPTMMEDGCIELDAQGHIHIYGYDWLNITKKGDEDYNDYTEEFLVRLAPLLAEKLIIHCVGNEKCRFPLASMCIEVNPKGKKARGAWEVYE